MTWILVVELSRNVSLDSGYSFTISEKSITQAMYMTRQQSEKNVVLQPNIQMLLSWKVYIVSCGGILLVLEHYQFCCWNIDFIWGVLAMLFALASGKDNIRPLKRWPMQSYPASALLEYWCVFQYQSRLNCWLQQQPKRFVFAKLASYWTGKVAT